MTFSPPTWNFHISILIAILAQLLCAAESLAQSSVPSTTTGGDPNRTASAPMLYNPYANVFSTSFDKLFDTYHWNGLLRYASGTSPLRINVNDQYVSTVILGDHKLVRDENEFGFGVRQRITDRLSAALQESSYVLSDNQKVGINTASSHAFYGGAEYRPFDQVTVEPLAGYRIDNQIDQRDRGPSYMLSLFANDFLDGYSTRLSGIHRYDRLDPRVLETHLDTLRLAREFSADARNALQVTFARNRRDFYFPADITTQLRFGIANNIETRTDNILGFVDSLEYVITPQTLLGIQGLISTRSIGREIRYQSYAGGLATPTSDIGEFRIEAGANIASSPWQGVDALFQVNYQERDEEHTLRQNDSIPTITFTTLADDESRKNNFARRTSLMLRATAVLSGSDSLAFNASTGILRYDTPSQLNTDDRDELRDVVGITWYHGFSHALSLAAVGEIGLTHLVYLNAQRSADNTWNRIYRLSPRLTYAPSQNFTSANAFEVLANYTIYDFDYGGSSVRSFTFRQFSFTDSTLWWLTGRFGLSWYQNMRLYERGELQWQEFSERPLAYFEDHTIIGTMRFRAAEGLLFSVGIRYFSQSRDRFVGADRVPESFLRSAGPVAVAELNFGRKTRILFNGWYEHQVQTGQPGRNVATLAISCALFL